MSPDEERELLTKVRELHAAMLARRGTPNSGAPAARSTAPAQKHDPNDPIVKVLPKSWKGEDLRGKRYSECPANFLGMLVHVLEASAERNDGDPDPMKQRYAKWDRENAETARRWRAKLEGKGGDDLFGGGRKPMSEKELDDIF